MEVIDIKTFERNKLRLAQSASPMTQPKIIHDVDSLLNEIRDLCRVQKGIISIDGFNGSGKTPLAKQLCSRLSADHIEADRFLEREKGGYLNYLRYDDLKEQIRMSSAQDALVLLEGVCMREILEKLCLKATVNIYVKEISAGGWCDGFIFQQYGSADEAIAGKEASVAEISRLLGEPCTPLTGLDRELIEYHFAFKPHETADLIFINHGHADPSPK